MQPTQPPRVNVAYVLRELGAPSETLIVDEMLSVLDAGCSLTVMARRESSSKIRHRSYSTVLERAQVLRSSVPERRRQCLALLRWMLIDPLRCARVLWKALRSEHRWIFAETLEPALRARGLGVERFHAHFADDNALYAAAMADWCAKPFGMTTHRYDIFTPPLRRSDLLALLRRAAPLVTISEFNRRWLVKEYGIGDDTISLVRCGIDLERFAFRFQPRTPSPASPELELLTVGRLVPEKAYHVLLQAVALLKSMGHRCRLKLVGDGPLGAALREQALQLELERDVSFLGAQTSEDVLRLHRTAHVFVSSSSSEGLPVVCVEALALGTPAVATAITGVPELIEHERTGLLVPPADPAALATALARYADDEALRHRVAHAGRQWVERHFDRGRCTADLIACWEREQGRPPRRGGDAELSAPGRDPVR